MGSPPSISRAGAGAWATPSVQARQAYFGRRITSTRNCAGTTSRRSDTSSPMRCSGPEQHGQLSSRDVHHGLDPRQVGRQGAPVGPAFGDTNRAEARSRCFRHGLIGGLGLLGLLQPELQLIEG